MAVPDEGNGGTDPARRHDGMCGGTAGEVGMKMRTPLSPCDGGDLEAIEQQRESAKALLPCDEGERTRGRCAWPKGGRDRMAQAGHSERRCLVGKAHVFRLGGAVQAMHDDRHDPVPTVGHGTHFIADESLRQCREVGEYISDDFHNELRGLNSATAGP